MDDLTIFFYGLEDTRNLDRYFYLLNLFTGNINEFIKYYLFQASFNIIINNKCLCNFAFPLDMLIHYIENIKKNYSSNEKTFVLDIGCGPMYYPLMAAFVNPNVNIIGLDLDEKVCDYTGLFAYHINLLKKTKKDLRSHVSLIIDDYYEFLSVPKIKYIKEVPIRQNQFHYIFIRNILSHDSRVTTPESIKKVMDHFVKDNLRKNGYAYISIDAKIREFQDPEIKILLKKRNIEHRQPSSPEFLTQKKFKEIEEKLKSYGDEDNKEEIYYLCVLYGETTIIKELDEKMILCSNEYYSRSIKINQDDIKNFYTEFFEFKDIKIETIIKNS